MGGCELVGEEGECGSDLGRRGSVEAPGDAEALQVVWCPTCSRLRRWPVSSGVGSRRRVAGEPVFGVAASSCSTTAGRGGTWTVPDALGTAS